MQEIHRKNSENHIIQKFENEENDLHITIDQNSNIKFGAIIKNCNLSFIFDIDKENTNIECYFLIPAINNQTTQLDIKPNFKASNTKAIINIIALANNNSSIILNWNVHIDKNINNVNAYLYEETLLLWNAKYISLIPWLKVDSPDVKASHWAKIQKISPERIFYMQSRWLSEEKATNMIIDSYSQQIISKLELNDKEKDNFYSMLN